jgi:hypothetical protein
LRIVREGGLTPSYLRGVQGYLDRLAKPGQTGVRRYGNGRVWRVKYLDELLHNW